MGAPYRPLHSITPKRSEMIGGGPFQWHKYSTPTREASRANQQRLEWERQIRAQSQGEIAAARTLIAGATGLRRRMLEQHSPEMWDSNGRLYCSGCEPCPDCRHWFDWPCETWSMAAAPDGAL